MTETTGPVRESNLIFISAFGHGTGDEGFEDALIGQAQDSGGDPSLFVEYEGGRDRLRRDVLGHGEQDAAVFVLHAGVGDVEGPFEGGSGGFLIADVDTVEQDLLWFELVPERFEPGSFEPARGACCVPEVQDDYFSGPVKRVNDRPVI